MKVPSSQLSWTVTSPELFITAEVCLSLRCLPILQPLPSLLPSLLPWPLLFLLFLLFLLLVQRPRSSLSQTNRSVMSQRRRRQRSPEPLCFMNVRRVISVVFFFIFRFATRRCLARLLQISLSHLIA